MKINGALFFILFVLATSCIDNTPETELGDYITGKAVGAGNSSTLVVHEDGTVKAIGYYALSDLSTVTGVTAAAIGHRNMLLLKENGTVLEVTASYAMKQVPDLNGIVAVSAGYLYSLALKQDGTVWAWGKNDYGQLGDSTFTDKSSPVQIKGFSGVIAISACFQHAVALRADGTVWAWGSNTYGEVGLPLSEPSRNYPIQIKALTGVKAIAAGGHATFALKNDGTLWALGGNGGGHLGTGTTEPYNTTPVQVTGLSDITAISAMGACLALKSDGTVWAWGTNTDGQLGDGSFMKRITPVPVSGLSNVKTILSSESSHSVAITNDGKIWTWGSNNYGQLGDPSTVLRRNTPSALRDDQ